MTGPPKKVLCLKKPFFIFLLDISRLTKIKDALPDYIEYNHIKVVIAVMVQKYGQTVLPTGEVVLEGSQESGSQGQDSQGPLQELQVCML